MTSSGAAAAEDYPYERRVVWFSNLGHGLMHLMELVYAGILPLLIARFGLSLAEVGVLVFPFLAMLGVGSLPAGLLSDRWSSYRVLLLFFFGMALAGLAAALSDSLWLLALSMGLLGLFSSLYHPTGLALLSLGVRRKGLAMGLNGVYGNLGLALSPFLAGLLGSRFGWQSAFLAPAAASFLCGVALLCFPLRIDPHAAAGREEREAAAENRHRPGSRRETLIWLYAVMIVIGFAYRGLMTYLPKHIGDQLPVSWLPAVAAGGLFASLALAAGAVGQIWGGHRSDHSDPFRLYFRVVPLFAPLLAGAALLAGWTLLAGLSLFFFFFFSSQPLENQMLARITPARYRSTGYGIKFGLNLGIGATAAPICGLIGDRFGLGWIFLFLAGVLVLAGLGILGLRRARHRALANALDEPPPKPAGPR